MTTKIIEYTYYPEESAPATTLAPETQTDSQSTASVETTTVTEAISQTVVTSAETRLPLESDSGSVSASESESEPEPAFDPAALLVNPVTAIPDGYKPDLVSIGNGQQADHRVKDALEAMLTDCRKAGYNPVVCSSYRTIERQRTLFENETRIFMEYGYDRLEAEEFAAKWTARPGYSEHHTGLAFDIVSASYQKLDYSQENTPEQKWLMKNCYNYGFILRYPDDKTEITGRNYEPWHYRYVGLEAAAEIAEKQITLEEYLTQE